MTSGSSSNGESQTPETSDASSPTFDALPLSPELRETIAEIGYVHPTPVQIAVWEPATRGRDAVVQARTGTGKTAAFGIPIVDSVVKRSVPHIQVLVLCPTRELSLQVSDEIERLAKRKHVNIAAVYGGAPMQRQIDALTAATHVIVGTPGRILDHLRRGTLNPKHIRMLVLDECDEMLSMGFERELNAILAELPPERQTLLFSATVPPDIERMARAKLRSPEFITLSGDAVAALEIMHFVYSVTGDKPGSLMKIIEVDNPESAIIFCNTREDTEMIAAALQRQGFDADWLNGDLPQADREKVMTATREGRLRFLVATDVAARGIDISHLTHVINYDFPHDAEGYVHRTGRTGRAGRTGTAISLITPQDIGPLYILRLTYKIRPLEKRIPSQGELKSRAEADIVALLADTFIPKGTHPDDLALARRLLSHDQVETVIAGLLREHLGNRPTAEQDASAARRLQKPRPASSLVVTPPTPLRQEDQPPETTSTHKVEAAPHETNEPEILKNTDTPMAPEARFSPDAERGRDRQRGRDRTERRVGRSFRDEPRDERNTRRSTSFAKPRDDAPHVKPDPLRSGPPKHDDSISTRNRHAATSEAAAWTTPAMTGGLGPHADFTSWQPPEEEGDDEPILTKDSSVVAQASPDAQPPSTSAPDDLEDNFVELFANLGRRDGARASDFQRLLVERADIGKNDVRRIRVRERNAFLSVRKIDLARALLALNGAIIAGKEVHAEQARERSSSPGDTAEET